MKKPKVKPPYNEPLYYEHLDFTNTLVPPGSDIILLHVLFFLYNESSIKRTIFNKRIQYKYMEIILFITNGFFLSTLVIFIYVLYIKIIKVSFV